jgi:2,3-bisphosphoglycerate-dependent phosphoglycerate mutase
MNNITRILTIRHGQTLYNLEKRYAGSIDIPLHEKGIEDAENAAIILKEYDLDIVITSKLKRAIQTAEILVAGRNIHIIQNKLCNERNYGRMQGLTYTEVEEIKPRIKYFKLNNDFHSLNPPDGETFPALRRRAKYFCEFIFQNYAGSNILVVSSSAFMQQLHGIFRGTACMESLRNEVYNLDCATFIFNGRKLIEDRTVSLRRNSSVLIQ